MDYTVFNWEQVIKKADLPANAKYIAFYLGTFMNAENDMAWPSLKRIEHETKLTRPTILKYIDVLVDEGFLIKGKRVHTSQGGEQLHNTYLVSIPEKVVKDVYHLADKGGKAALQRGLNSSTKGVKHVNPNNNRITKNNNSIKFPFWNDDKAWENLGKQYGIQARPSENWNEYKNRIKTEIG